MSTDVKNNLLSVRERIAEEASKAGRPVEDIRLIVVTKGHSIPAIEHVISLGARDLGENYVNEALAKQESISEAGLNWHMIGHVQSRKAAAVVGRFAMVQSVDSLKLAQRLDRAAAESDLIVPVLLEMNVSEEANKYGWHVLGQSLSSQALSEIEQVLELRNLAIHGLMGMAPLSNDPMHARPFFSRLRTIRDGLQTRFPQGDWSQLSMGMSDDYPAAIHEGATILRIGTAIMGPRPSATEM